MDPPTDAFGDVRDFLAGIICSAQRRADRVAAYVKQDKQLRAWCRREDSPPQLVREVLVALDIALQLEACEWAGARATPDFDFPSSEAVLNAAHRLADGCSAELPYHEIGNRLLVWSSRHLSWDGLQGNPLRLDPSIAHDPEQLLAELAELLLEGHRNLVESNQR